MIERDFESSPDGRFRQPMGILATCYPADSPAEKIATADTGGILVTWYPVRLQIKQSGFQEIMTLQ